MHNLLETIIAERNILTLFQPIFSVKDNRVIGVEALSRGLDAAHCRVLSADQLFALPRTPEEKIALDRLCIESAVRTFVSIPERSDRMMLFLNLSSFAIENDPVYYEAVMDIVRRNGLSPEHLVIEIVESQITDIVRTKQIISRFRAEGAVIALDDVGAGHSNLNRIPLANPDIIKVDRSLLDRVSKDFTKREILKSLVSLSKNIGTLVLAEGIEYEDDAVASFRHGADLFQGFYFSHPVAHDVFGSLAESYPDLLERVKNGELDELARKKEKFRTCHDTVDTILTEMEAVDDGDFEAVLSRRLSSVDFCECGFILDEEGEQITELVFSSDYITRKNRILFSPSRAGDSHVNKNYYYIPHNSRLERYTTDAYISRATGNICQTIASYFTGADGRRYLFCMDIVDEYR